MRIGVLALVVLLFVAAVPAEAGQAAPGRFRLAIGGLTHGHVYGFLHGALERTDVEIVGVYEPDDALRRSYLEGAKLPASVGFSDLDEMLAKTSPEALAIFSATVDHPRFVEAAARHHVAAMMEKPLAVSVEDGETIRRAAEGGRIPVIVNYETTWYQSLAGLWQTIKADRTAGVIRKMVAMDGHEGPKEIGVQPEFLAWLTDPVKNGAGALYDFGCYGANIMTWLMDNERPRSVRALTQQLKPAIYPKVDDEATILLEYATAQGIIQASWNWPFGRKDVEVYAEKGYAKAIGGGMLRTRINSDGESNRKLAELAPERRDSISYLIAVARGTIQPDGLSSLQNNLIVTEILAAARDSAKTGRAVVLGPTSSR